MSPLEFRPIDTPEQIRRIFPILKELREHLEEPTFLHLYEAARRESSYQIIGAFEAETCVAIMGYRILTDFVHGRHLYIDDLVTANVHRSKGIGSRLLAHAKQIAAAENCTRLRLCTGADNDRGKVFYARNGWNFRAVVYKTQI